MQQIIKDTAGLGIFFWMIGYFAGIVLFFTPFKDHMGWIMLVTLTPFTLLVTWWWFRQRMNLSSEYYAGVGIAWMLIAVALDFLFIVTLFQSATYYALDVFLYYVLMVLVPVGVGIYLRRAVPEAQPG